MGKSIGTVKTPLSLWLSEAKYPTAPDLLMVMMNYGQGSSAARAAVFFLALGFGLTSMFENICVSLVLVSNF
jgi:NCS1 family nucleobase:cation symporter-1